ncbi:MAG TPA: hypothetical protein VIA62_14250 [Thermoanaerobaculia bacterium]|nr:hypothetical protein [Thermoanaerobaculia bacterium]
MDSLSKTGRLEALSALALFQRAAAREEASLDLVRRIATYLNRARRDPGLRFQGEG